MAAALRWSRLQAVEPRVSPDLHARAGRPARAKLLMLGVAPDGRGSAEFIQFQRSDIDTWGKVIKNTGIQAE